MQPTGAIGKLMEELGKLPGIGPKSAERITHFLLACGTQDVLALADALRDIVQKVHPCRQCYNLTEGELCGICGDARRDASLICVVEQARDVASLERAGAYRGVYHVLQGRLAPLDGVGPEKLTIDALVHRVSLGGVKEIIMATNPTLEGDGTALYVSNLLAGSNVKITRLARGLPSGSVLEFANTQMLADALEGRRVF
ncbi:MAG: recombination protein RecR [Planctomycetes bacterium]|nr:recombination protein RecR [Planctomycetota bacterium]